MHTFPVRLLREPLLHFLLLGSALFVLFHFVGTRDEQAPDEIVVTTGTIEHLAATFARTWQRPPTAEELDGLIADYIREEVFYREATVLGLDRDDTIIRRRMRQKLEFIADDVAAQAEPSDDELRAYFERHATSHRQPDRFTFRHVYLAAERHGENLQRETERLLALLNDGGTGLDPEEVGDQLLLPSEFRDASQGDVSASFGEPFAAELQNLPRGRWAGPVRSGYGVHLVRLEERIAGRVPSLAEVRDAVIRDWQHERRQQAIEDLFQNLSRRYTVRVEKSPPAGEGVAQVHE
jgi:hypothetical protein